MSKSKIHSLCTCVMTTRHTCHNRHLCGHFSQKAPPKECKQLHVVQLVKFKVFKSKIHSLCSSCGVPIIMDFCGSKIGIHIGFYEITNNYCIICAIFTPHTCTRGQVISCVVVNKNIAQSGDLGPPFFQASRHTKQKKCPENPK